MVGVKYLESSDWGYSGLAGENGRKGYRMHLAIRYYRVDPDSVEEVMRRVDEGFVPIISSAPGFLA